MCTYIHAKYCIYLNYYIDYVIHYILKIKKNPDKSSEITKSIKQIEKDILKLSRNLECHRLAKKFENKILIRKNLDYAYANRDFSKINSRYIIFLYTANMPILWITEDIFLQSLIFKMEVNTNDHDLYINSTYTLRYMN